MRSRLVHLLALLAVPTLLVACSSLRSTRANGMT